MATSCGFIIINTDNKLLIAHPTNDFSGVGIWTFPKGHMEIGETEMECALREVFEETNLDLTKIKGSKSLLCRTERNGREVVFFVFKSKEDLTQYDIKCNSIVEYEYEVNEPPIYENDDFKWVDIYSISQYLGDRERNVVEKYFLKL